MDNTLEQKNIIITVIEMLVWGVKITDEKGLKYNIPQYKKGTQEETVAYQHLSRLPKMGSGLNKCFKFVSVQNSQGGQSRYVRVITDPVAEGQPTTYTSPQMSQAKPVTIEKEATDWDKISWGKCKHAYLVENFKKVLDSGTALSDDEFANIEQRAEIWADMSMRRLSDIEPPEPEINIDNIPSTLA